MNSPIPVAVSDQEILPFCQVDCGYAAVNEKSSVYLINGKEKTDFDQWMTEIQQGVKSFDALMIMINKLMQEFALVVRDVNMRIRENYIRQRIDEFTKAVEKVIGSIKSIANIEAFIGFGELVVCGTIGVFQLRSQQWANILGSFRDSAVGLGAHAGGALLKKAPQIEGELGNKEKTLNDVWHQIEQNAQEWFKEASRLFAQLAEVMANFWQQLQSVLSVPRH